MAEHRFADAVLSTWGIDVHESSDVLPLDRETLKQALEEFRALSIELWKEQAQFSTFQGRQISQDSRPLVPHGSRSIPMDILWSSSEMERT